MSDVWTGREGRRWAPAAALALSLAFVWNGLKREELIAMNSMILHTHSVAGATPILALDMYEHSYHLDYGAAAAKYVDAFMENINWTNIARLHQAHAR